MHPKSKLRPYVLDVNIWLSIIIGGHLELIQSYLKANAISLIVSPLLIDELRDVLSRQKFKKYLSLPVSAYTNSVRALASMKPDAPPPLPPCPDPDDAYLFGLARLHAATLVTGDKALLGAAPAEGIAAISFAAFRRLGDSDL